ncbi:MAG: hypothetical protein IK078_04305 [Lachnospiraceae bacterium]|nr:hypothetical protein [Lachnospiraceae bacterium]
MEQTRERATFNGIPVLKAGEGYGNYTNGGRSFLVPYPVEDVPDEEYAKMVFRTNMYGRANEIPSWVTKSGSSFDFSELEEGNNKQSLYDTALSFYGTSLLSQDYAVVFGGHESNTIESYIQEGDITYDMHHTIFNINIDDVTTGEELVNKIQEVVGGYAFKQPGEVSFGYSGSTLSNSGSGSAGRGGSFYGDEMEAANLYDIRIQAGPEIKDCIDFRLPSLPDFNDLRRRIDLVNGTTENKRVHPYVDENGMSRNDRDVPLSNIDAFKETMYIISRERSRVGAAQNRLEHSYMSNLNTAENTTAAESAIRDTDMAKEMVQNAKENILQQVGQSMLSQANQNRQGLLQLLG